MLKFESHSILSYAYMQYPKCNVYGYGRLVTIEFAIIVAFWNALAVLEILFTRSQCIEFVDGTILWRLPQCVYCSCCLRGIWWCTVYSTLMVKPGRLLYTVVVFSNNNKAHFPALFRSYISLRRNKLEDITFGKILLWVPIIMKILYLTFHKPLEVI